MKLSTLFLFIFFSFNSVLAFDIKTIDESKEGIEKAKKEAQKIIRASDGKVIVQALPKTILKPIKVEIIKAYKPIVKPLKRKIIYPIGTQPPKEIEQENSDPTSSTKTKEEDDVFLSSDSIIDKKADDIKFNVDTDFKKDTETTTPEKPKIITPVNIE